MSFTRSRNLFDATHWATQAVTIQEHLQVRSAFTPFTLNALRSLEEFFEWVVAGVWFETEKRTPEKGIPLMGAICAVSIVARSIRQEGSETTLAAIKEIGERCLLTVRRLRKAKRIVGTKEELKEFRTFLLAFIEEAERARDRRRCQASVDDDDD